ncbi:MAG: ABC transporter substrate-binding protein [Lachnospiraceae bacterium]|nr:ABC transporter substrate-binding protein [Lachnospiraceae bacterium]
MKISKIKSIITILIVSIFVCSCSGKSDVNPETDSSTISYDRTSVFDYSTEITQNYNVINEIDSGWNIIEYNTCHSFAKQLDSENCNFYIAVTKDLYAILNESYFINTNSQLNYNLSLSVNSEDEIADCLSLFEKSDSLSADLKDKAAKLSDNVTKGNTIIASTDILGSDIYVFFNEYDDDFDLTDFLCVVLETDGTIKNVISFDDYMNIHGMEPAEHDHDHVHDHEEHDVTQAYNAVLTGPDSFVLWNNFSNEFTYINTNDKSVDVSAIEDCIDSYIRFTGKTESGIPVFEYSDSNSNLTIFMASDEVKKITSGRIDAAECRFLAENGLIYYISGNYLYCWDVSTGICQKIYVFNGLDYCTCKNIHTDDSGNIIIMFYDTYESKLFEYTLSSTEEINKTDFVIYKYCFDEYINDCASDFSRMHPSINITVKTIEEEENSANLLALDIKDGKGPDIIVTNRNMMSTLEHAKLLKPLDDVLDPDIEKNLFSGVLNNGIIDNHLYGVSFSANIYTIAGTKGLIDKSDWNINTLMSEYKKLKAADPSIRLMAVPNYCMTSDQLLLILVTLGLDNTPFVDLESMTCSFDSPEFIEYLNFLKEVGEDKNAAPLSEGEAYKMLADKKAMLTIIEGGLVSFSQNMSAIYKYCDIYGLPLKEGTDILTSYNCITASSYSDKDDLIKEFINLALSEECQVKYSTDHVRKDVLLNHVFEHTDITEEPIILIGGHHIIPLSAKEDNSSFVHEFIDLMDNSVPATVEYEIRSIIMEEASAFFEGAKSAEEVAKLIQSRVQLYLDERK